MSGLNKLMIIGNIGTEPETRYSQSGNAMTTLSVATSETWKDKTTGEKQERTEWHRVKLFGRMAETASKYLKKGAKVYFEGSVRTQKYTDKQGVERYASDLYATEMQFLSPAPQPSK